MIGFVFFLSLLEWFQIHFCLFFPQLSQSCTRTMNMTGYNCGKVKIHPPQYRTSFCLILGDKIRYCSVCDLNFFVFLVSVVYDSHNYLYDRRFFLELGTFLSRPVDWSLFIHIFSEKGNNRFKKKHATASLKRIGKDTLLLVGKEIGASRMIYPSAVTMATR